jgi:hypothetical protein
MPGSKTWQYLANEGFLQGMPQIDTGFAMTLIRESTFHARNWILAMMS